MELIKKYFPEVSVIQIKQFEQLLPLYQYWNEQINVISRKDIETLYERHVLHSLGIAKFIALKEHTKVLDVGTGGGFPGIPLAIFFPNVHFHLIDSIGKKIKVVEEVTKKLQLVNVTFEQTRAENVTDKYDFVVSRAVTQMPIFIKWVQNKILFEQKNYIDNGILYLKGGDLSEELKTIKNKRIIELSDYFKEEFFDTKKLVYIKL